MSTKELEKRITEIESQLLEMRRQLKSAVGKRSTQNWRRAIAAFSGDDDLQRIFTEAMKLREANRERARVRETRARKPRK